MNMPEYMRTEITQLRFVDFFFLFQQPLHSTMIYERGTLSSLRGISSFPVSAHTLPKDSHTPGTSCPTLFE